THHGIDIGAAAGTPALAVAPGVVYYAGPDVEIRFGPSGDFYGNVVVLQLAQEWRGHRVYALYGHLNEVTVQPGQPVAEGEALGHVGATGVALGPHLHLEARLDNPDSYWAVYNPELWLRPFPGSGALAVRVVNAAGRYLPGVRVELACADGAPRFADTYWDAGVNPDPGWGENAALTNLPPGRCNAQAFVGAQVLEGSATVEAGRTAFLLLTMP
ncbi:MAG: M23 family metallopeptidase, partial [Chloroflexi bacterium]|nr:M23 family metallopeptidase [Chloroflexota bacterium]